MTDDTNRRVAEACGLEIYNVCPGDDVSIVTSEYHGCILFDPKSRAADAVLAAEKFGLFQERHCCLTQINGQWVVMRGETILGSGTFCEAICQAILKLHESNAST